ncbi:MAG: TonB-dependent receptor [Pseudobdellovibrio sp.]
MKFFCLILFTQFLVLSLVPNALAFDYKATILEKGSQNPLKDIVVTILPDKLIQRTNQKGEVSFNNIQAQQSNVIISLSGYLRFDKAINLSEKNENLLYIEKDNYNDFETIIISKRAKRDQSQKTLTRKEFLAMPGANGDPLKAVQNLPGVNRSTGFSSQVVIQGSAPKDTAYDFEGHDIPIVFHFGGLSSVVMPEAIEQIDYLSAGYGAEYSRALGGIISLKVRKPDVQERDQKGLFYADNLSAGGLYEAKIDEKSSFLISGRYSYIGFFLKQALKNTDSLDLTVAPEFQDLTAVYNNEISEIENFKISLLGSRDRLAFVLNEPLRSDPSIRGSFSNTINFFRLIPSYTLKMDTDTTAKISLGLGKDEIGVEIGDQYLKIASNVVTNRAEWDKKISSEWQMQLGLDNEFTQSKVDLRLPLRTGDGGVSNPISIGEKRQVQISGSRYNLGSYFRNQINVSEEFELLPSLRFDQFSQTKESFLLPRFAARYKFDDGLLLKMGTGLYTQPPEPQESNSDIGNSEIKSPRAISSMLGFEKDYRGGNKEGSVLSAGVFERWFSNLVIPSSATVTRNGSTMYELYNNNGSGRAFGFESQWKFNQTVYNGFISYTWSKSTRKDPINPEYNFEYDQTHNFNLVLAHDFTDLWKISGRLRYVTGNPSTPIMGSTYDSDNEVYIPKRGALYSSRLNDFKQLDIRVDKKVIFDKAIWSFYLDIQNILNAKNPETIQYSYDYSQKTEISGLPFLPAIGVKGEF